MVPQLRLEAKGGGESGGDEKHTARGFTEHIALGIRNAKIGDSGNEVAQRHCQNEGPIKLNHFAPRMVQ